MADANADKTASSDKHAKPASSADELVKDLDVKEDVSKEAQDKITGGWPTKIPDPS